MSRASSPELSLSLDCEKNYYIPGDKVSGKVQLESTEDVTIGKIKVFFSGQSSTKILQSNGQSKSTFEDFVTLFRFEQTLHDDHFKHKGNIFIWPFEFTVPDMLAMNSSSNEIWKGHQSSLLPPNGSTTKPPPPSFYLEHSEAGKHWFVATTYSLEVVMIESSDSSILQRSRNKDLVKSVQIRPCPTNEPFDLNNPQYRLGVTTIHTIRSLSLTDRQLRSQNKSLLSKAKYALNLQSLPQLAFELDVSYSTVLQVNHPEQIPFVVSVTPKTGSEWTTVQPEMVNFYRYPNIKVKRFQLFLPAVTGCRCKSAFGYTTVEGTEDILLTDRHFESLPLAMRCVAWDQKRRLEDDRPCSADLGEACGVRITDTLSCYLGQRNFKICQVTPSFSTSNIVHRYYFRWVIELECVGEKITVKGTSPDEITLLGPPLSSPMRSLQGEPPPSDAIWRGRPSIDEHYESGIVSSPPVGADEILPTYAEINGTNTTMPDCSRHSPKRSQRSERKNRRKE